MGMTAKEVTDAEADPRQRRFTARARLAGAAGFTLVETVVVVMIMVAITATLLPVITSVIQDSRIQSTLRRLQVLADALEAFAADTRAAPGQLGHLLSPQGESCDYRDANWRGPYIAEASGFATDAWGRRVGYQRRDVGIHDTAETLPGSEAPCFAMAVTAQLISGGVDGRLETTDDLVEEARISSVIRSVALGDSDYRLRRLRQAIAVYAAEFYGPGSSGWSSLADTSGEWVDINSLPEILEGLRRARLLPAANAPESTTGGWPFNGSDRFVFDGFGKPFQVRGRAAQLLVRSRYRPDA